MRPVAGRRVRRGESAARRPTPRCIAAPDGVVRGRRTRRRRWPSLQKVAAERGVNFTAVAARPAAPAARLARPRVGLWDQYGGSMDAGWARWILEQFEFPFDRVFAPRARRRQSEREVRRADLRRRRRFPARAGGGAAAGAAAAAAAAGAAADAAAPPNVPEEYRDQIGAMTADRTLPQLQAFVENGGTVIAIGGSATNLGRVPRPADRESPGRERRAAAADEVLRARLGAARARRHVAARSRPA